MVGGRPRQGKAERRPEFAELAQWFRQALTSQNFSSPNEFAQHLRGVVGVSTLYRLYNGEALIELDIVKAVAGGLGQDVAQAEQVWIRAKEAQDRRVTAEKLASAPRLESWTQLPRASKLEPTVRNLLESLSIVTDVLPYRKFDLEPPPLSAVYVRQRVHHSTASAEQTESADTRDRRQPAKDRPVPAAKDQTIPAAEALNQQEHLIVVGDPGSGKSTFTRHLAGQLARIWLGVDSATEAPLRKPVLPVLVAARDLVEERRWPEVLAKATSRTLSRKAISEPLPALFEGPVHGARWLVFVDGLDEIINQDARAKVVADLAAHARSGSPYRFVVTTRGLTVRERSLLRGYHVYAVQPFGRPELRDFAKRWFTAQTSPELAGRYLHQISDGRLHTLAGSPLLATIAAIALTTQPDRPLPASRVDLYSRFFDLLTDEEASGRSTEKELLESWASQSSKQRFATWVHERWPGLVDRLARYQVEQSGALLAEAAGWVRASYADQHPMPRDWEVILRDVLLATGLFVRDDRDLRFLHHSLAEFLAAKAHARDIPAEFPDLDEWIKRGLSADQRTFALFTFALWAKQGNDLDLVLGRLQAGTVKQLLLAGRILAETSADTGAMVVDRLIDVAVAQLTMTETSDGYSCPEAFTVLAELTGNEVVADRLRRILDRAELRLITRIEAAIAFGRVTGPQQALPYLTTLAADADVWELLRAASGLNELFPDEPQHAVGLLLPLRDDLPQPPAARAALAKALSVVEENHHAINIARSVVTDPRAPFDVLAEACETWLAVTGPSAVHELTDTVAARSDFGSWDPTRLVSALIKLGCRGEAATLARKAATNETRHVDDLDDAVEAWLTAAGVSAVDEIMAIVARHDLDPWARARLAKVFADAGHHDIAIDFAQQVLDDPQADLTDRSTAAEAVVATGTSDAIGDMLPLLEAGAGSSLWERARLAETLADLGECDRSVELARTILAAPAADTSELVRATEAWFTAQGGLALSDVLAALARRPSFGPAERAGLLTTLTDMGGHRQAVTWAWEILAEPDVDMDAVRDAIRCLLSQVGFQAIEQIIVLVKQKQSIDSFEVIANLLLEFGALTVAASLWRELLVEHPVPKWTRLTVAESLVDSGYRAAAIESLHEALAKADRPTERTQLQQLLAWVMLSDPDVKLTSENAARQVVIRGGEIGSS